MQLARREERERESSRPHERKEEINRSIDRGECLVVFFPPLRCKSLTVTLSPTCFVHVTILPSSIVLDKAGMRISCTPPCREEEERREVLLLPPSLEKSSALLSVFSLFFSKEGGGEDREKTLSTWLLLPLSFL